MRQYVLDGQNMTTLEAAYDELEQIFALPEYFGRNLDALESVWLTYYPRRIVGGNY
jgi:RNAse (barnase) inhibitor barstar